MLLSNVQRAAICKAQLVLEAAGLSLSDLSVHTPYTSDTALTNDPAIDSNPLLGAKSAFDYDLPAARHFTDAEIAAKANCLNQKS